MVSSVSGRVLDASLLAFCIVCVRCAGNGEHGEEILVWESDGDDEMKGMGQLCNIAALQCRQLSATANGLCHILAQRSSVNLAACLREIMGCLIAWNQPERV